MNIAGFHQWLILSGASGNNTPDTPSNLPFTGQPLALYIAVGALIIMIALTLREIADRDG